MMREGGYSSVACSFAQIAGTAVLGKVLRDELMAIRRAIPTGCSFWSVTVPDEVKADYEAGNVPVFEDATRAVVAIAAMGRFGDAFARAARRAATADPRRRAAAGRRRARPTPSVFSPPAGIPVAAEHAAADARRRPRQPTGSATPSS